MKHDFKAALGAVIAGHDTQVEYPNSINRLTLDELKAIIHALRIADRLMGEPSDRMYVAFMNEFNSYQPMTESFDAGFKAMRDQMIKEIEQEQHH